MTVEHDFEMSRSERFRYGWLGAFIGTCFGVWLVLSLHYFIASEASFFARLGSFGAVVMIMCLALTRHSAEGLSKNYRGGDLGLVQEMLEYLESTKPETITQLPEESQKKFQELKSRESLLKRYVEIAPIMPKYILYYQMLEVLGLMLSAIQGGYGDFFVNRFNGCGRWQCP